jgi:predicted SnoaL-like aldol condensation-catalyzing enzyme
MGQSERLGMAWVSLNNASECNLLALCKLNLTKRFLVEENDIMATPSINLTKLAKAHWSDEDTQKAKSVVSFVQLIMNDHNFTEVRQTFSDNPYKQHNRGMEDGIDGVVKSVSALVKSFPEFSYDVKHIYVDGDHVILHSHVTGKEKQRGNPNQGFNIIDNWKVVDGKLVEHWDAIQGINFMMRLYAFLSGGKIGNSNSLF